MRYISEANSEGQPIRAAPVVNLAESKDKDNTKSMHATIITIEISSLRNNNS